MPSLKDVKNVLTQYSTTGSIEAIGSIGNNDLEMLMSEIVSTCSPELMKGIIPTLSQWFDTISLRRGGINPQINNNLSSAYELEQQTIRKQIDEFLSASGEQDHDQLADDAIINFISLMSFVE